MTINNWEEYKANLWDWAILDGCFGESKISPTDIDGLVERNGKFLLIETKAPGADLRRGQEITFERLVSLRDRNDRGYFMVIVVWGKRNEPERLELWTPGHRYSYPQADINTLRNTVSWWFEWANG